MKNWIYIEQTIENKIVVLVDFINGDQKWEQYSSPEVFYSIYNNKDDLINDCTGGPIPTEVRGWNRV